ncbi:S8 family peptidase [Oceanithermus sp.]
MEPKVEPEGVSRFDGLAYKPGELIVYSSPLSPQSAEAASLEARLGVQKIADLREPGWHLYRVPAGKEEQLAQEIVASGLAEYAQPNYSYKLLYTPNDPYYTTVDVTGSQELQFGFMGVENAWDELLPGGCRPIVGVIDTGVAYDHPDLIENVIGGYDFSDNDADPYPDVSDINNPNDSDTDNFHGTMVASIIGAETNNSQGMAGVTSNLAYIMPLKVFPNSYSSTIASAIDWAVDNGANILNMSMCIQDTDGTCADLTSSPDATIEAALERAYNSGVISLAASGNYDQSFVGYPASSQYTIAVGATDNSNPPERADSTVWGTGYGSNYGDDLDVVAPGTDVLGAVIPSPTDPEPYMWGYGTSFATPYAAGVMALYISQYYAYSQGSLPDPVTATNCIRSAAEDLGTAGFDIYTGMGMVRADNMLDTATNAYGCY